MDFLKQLGYTEQDINDIKDYNYDYTLDNIIINKEKVEDISILTKLATYMGVKLNITDKNDMSSVAKMLIQGSTVTINQIEQKLQEYNIKSKYIHNLTSRLIAIEKNNIQNLEKFTG